MPRCLVVHPGALGDVLLAGPALGHLRALGFGTTLAVTTRLVSLFKGSGLVDDACDLESLGPPSALRRAARCGGARRRRELRRPRLLAGAGDSAFRANLARLGRPTVVARAVAAAGDRPPREPASPRDPGSAGPLPRPASLRLRLRATDASRAVAGAWLAARGLGPAEAVALQPGAGSAAKVWPGFAVLADRLRAAGLPLVALAGPADGPAVQTLLEVGALQEDACVRDWPLPDIAALLSLARAVGGQRFGPDPSRGGRGLPDRGAFSGRPIRRCGRHSDPMSRRAPPPQAALSGRTSITWWRRSGPSSAAPSVDAPAVPVRAGVGA